jgi:glycosyltransferase involved in cell wall biosynthesis
VARSVGFAVNLPRFGIDPCVLTVATPRARTVSGLNEDVPAGIRIERAPELNLPGLVAVAQGVANRASKLVRRRELGHNYFSRYLCVPDEQIAWMLFAKGLRLARRSDCVYVSCSPFSSALGAVAIAKAAGRPLIVDFRDAWSVNPTHTPTPWEARANRALERWALTRADRVVLNTESALATYCRMYPHLRAKFLTIPNGYDALALAPARPAHDKRFRIVHVGQFYGVRQPDALLDALADLQLPDLEFLQVGASFAAAERFRDRLAIRITGVVPRGEALAHLQSASLLYLKQHDTAGAAHIAVAAKTYEYLATGLPILADCPPGENAALVDRYASWPYVVTSGEKQDLADAVLRAYRDRGARAPRLHPEFVSRFSRDTLTAQLAAVVRDLCAARREQASKT